MWVCVSMSTIVVHTAAQNIFDYFPSWPPDNRHGSNAGGRGQLHDKIAGMTSVYVLTQWNALFIMPQNFLATKYGTGIWWHVEKDKRQQNTTSTIYAIRW